MTEKKKRHHKFFHRNLLFLVVIGIGLVFLFGHGRFGGWGWKKAFSGEPTKVEEVLSEIQEELADELEIRPEQKASFDAFSEKMKVYARKRLATMHSARTAAKAELEQDQPNPDQLGELAKKMIRQRGSTEELDSLVDETVAFYKTLDVEQQETIRDHLRRHHRWRH